MITIKHTARVNPDGLILWSAKAIVTNTNLKLINLTSVLNLWYACPLWFLLFGKCNVRISQSVPVMGWRHTKNLSHFKEMWYLRIDTWSVSFIIYTSRLVQKQQKQV